MSGAYNNAKILFAHFSVLLSGINETLLLTVIIVFATDPPPPSKMFNKKMYILKKPLSCQKIVFLHFYLLYIKKLSASNTENEYTLLTYIHNDIITIQS